MTGQITAPISCAGLKFVVAQTDTVGVDAAFGRRLIGLPIVGGEVIGVISGQKCATTLGEDRRGHGHGAVRQDHGDRVSSRSPDGRRGRRGSRSPPPTTTYHQLRWQSGMTEI